MSLTFEVIRDRGDKAAPDDIICAYFQSENIFRQVGRVAIDESTIGMKITSITLPGMRKHTRVGRIIRILDSGREYRAKVKSVLFSVGRQEDGKPFATCSMTLRTMEVL